MTNKFDNSTSLFDNGLELDFAKPNLEQNSEYNAEQEIEVDNEPYEFYDDFNFSFLGAVSFLLLTFVAGIWIMQKSVNAYYMQTYHNESPISKINHPIWKMGENIGDWLYLKHGKVADAIALFNQNHIDEFNSKYIQIDKVITEKQGIAQTIQPKPELTQTKQEFQGASLAIVQEPSYVVSSEPVLDQKALLTQSLTLNKNQKVFFAGDSMMQGVAPHIQKYLQGLGIKSINLSKQSTGLSYPKFFDWNKTIKKTINNDSSIKVLIVMLGPNDPWNINDKTGKNLKFKTKEWDNEYQSRMADIIEFVKAKNIGIIWVTPPNMKKDQLNTQMNHLNDVMMAELKRHNLQMIDSRPIMGGQNNRYHDYLKKDGKQIKMRTGDGVHFSPEGQRILAKEVQSYLVIE